MTNDNAHPSLAGLTKGQVLALRDERMAAAGFEAKVSLDEKMDWYTQKIARLQERQEKDREKLEKKVSRASSKVREAFDIILASM